MTVSTTSDYLSSRAMETTTEGAATRRHAFQKAYRDHLPWLWNVVRRLGVEERDLPDVSHDVFASAWQQFDDYDRARPLRPWLYGIACGLVTNRRRRRRGSEELPGELPEMAHSETPEARFAADQTRDAVLASLAALDDQKRHVFVAHEIEGFTIPHIADALGISHNTAYSRLRLARAVFHETWMRLQEGAKR